MDVIRGRQSQDGGLTARSGRRPGGLVRRHRLVVVVLAAVLVMTACGSSSKKSTSSTTAQGSTSSSTSSSGQVPPGNDIGITPTQIHIAVIADVNNSIVPGLFKSNVDAVQAWAKIVNANGGLAGRQVVVDFLDGKLDQNATRNAVIQACASDFAMVGNATNLLTVTSDMEQCKNSQGQPIGIPNLPGIGLGTPEQCSPVTFAVSGGNPTYCATQHDNPQTYTVQVGPYRYYLSQNPGLHGIFLYNGDVPSVRVAQVPQFTAAVNLGLKADGQGFYSTSDQNPQSAFTPVVSVLKQHSSQFAEDESGLGNMVLFQREAQLQGVNTMKVWTCISVCYDTMFLQQGGATVNGTYEVLSTLPFYSEYQSNPALSALVQQLGGINNLNGDGLSSYVEALLFQDAVNKAVANGGTLSRQSLFNVLHNQEHSFTAQGVVGPTDVSNHALSPCFALAQVKNGQFVRAYPTKSGTFDCSSDNVVQIKLNMNG
jgi:hypothetical protein